MKKIFLALALAISVSACNYSDIEFKGINGLSNTSFTKEKVGATVNLSIANPNKFNIKIKPSELDLTVNGVYLGKVQLKEKVKLTKKVTNQVDVPVEIHLDKGILMKLAAIGMKGLNSLEVNIKGDIKGSVAGFNKTESFNFTKNMPLKDLGLDLNAFKLPF